MRDVALATVVGLLVAAVPVLVAPQAAADISL